MDSTVTTPSETIPTTSDTDESLVAATSIAADEQDLREELVPALGQPEASAQATPKRPWLIVRAFLKICSAVEWLFGLGSMIFILAVLATIPIVNMLSLGYLLEVSGRIARTGKFSEGFIGIRTAARIGSLALGTWLMFIPLRLLSGFWTSSYLIDAESVQSQRLWIGLVAATLLIGGHVAWAWFRGGKLRHFIWPAPLKLFRRLFSGGMYSEARDNTLEFIKKLRVWHYFSLGVRGFLGTFLWLAIPVLWMILARQLSQPVAAVLVSLPGMLLFCIVLLYLPFVQAHFAAENRWGALFEIRKVGKLFAKAPIAFWTALFITLLFALPLYLLKIELIDREIAWLPSLVFVAFMLPARFLSGWAVARARRRAEPRHFIFRWLARLGNLPVVFLYVFFMYLALYVSWRGAYGLLEQHAFLVPVPFLGG
ncbi:MAG: hypothetical protein COA78_23480 [Blastopirellula sp.]|nr:MAG: hypothetical protein COA78_23480 [Blastopirellula sp.]